MRCEVYECRNNADGYCMCASYVTIEKDGTCSELSLRPEAVQESGTKEEL